MQTNSCKKVWSYYYNQNEVFLHFLTSVMYKSANSLPTFLTFLFATCVLELFKVAPYYRGLSEPGFYGDLVYKLKKIVGSDNFSARFVGIISHCKRIGYNISVLRRAACLVVSPITVGNFAFLFNCTPVGRTSDSMMVPT